MQQLEEAISSAVLGVTKKWARQRKAEERHAAARWRRRQVLSRDREDTIKEAADEVMEEAYNKAGSNGRLPALARQIMYAARAHILERTGKDRLNTAYFTQVLLPDYIERHGRQDWNVVWDARGHFREPHTRKEVDLGLAEVRGYLHGFRGPEDAEPGIPRLSLAYPTRGPVDRFGAVLFIEKEGFDPLLSAAKIAERHDVAIMSTKGMSVTAARELVDRLGVPLLVLHDFDQAGFSILGSLRRSTRRYRFRGSAQVIDAGLRLADIETYGLGTEYQRLTQNPWTLRENGATSADIAFLQQGQRVELNALTSEQLVALIEARLSEAGVSKVVPGATRLETAYRRAYRMTLLNRAIDAAAEQASRAASEASIPDDIDRLVRARLEEDPGLAWDDAIASLVAEAFRTSP